MVKATPASEAGVPPDQALFDEWGKYNAELIKAGVLLAAEGLHPSTKGVRIRISANGDRTVMDGPFTEAKELVAGFSLIQVKSLDEAVAWVKRAPKPHDGEAEIEIRQVIEMEDFGVEIAPERVAAKERLRAENEIKATS
jgi:hypothetical protein